MERLLASLSDLADRRRWWIVGVWVALLLAALPFAGRVTGKLSNGGFDVPGSQSLHQIHYVDAHSGGAQDFRIVVSAPSAAAAEARIGEVLVLLRRFPHITAGAFPCAPGAGTTRRVGPAYTCGSRDGRVQLLTGYAAVNQNEALKLAKRLSPVVSVHDGPVRTYLTGS